MDRLLKEQYIRGLSVAFVTDGNLTYKQYGRFHTGAEPDTDEASKNLVFEIGSITKALTGIALASMVEDGKLTLDTQLSDILPEMKKNSAAGSRTTGQLATHTSGLPRLPSDLFDKSPKSDPYSKYTTQDLINNTNKLDHLNPAGTTMEYSNLGFGLLGVALAKAHSSTGNFDAMIRDRVLSPLDMNETSTTARLTTTGYSDSLIAAPEWKFDGLKAAGGLRSTPNDMMKLLKALANPSQSKLKNAIEKSMALASPPEHPPHGLAWVHGVGDNKDIIWHNGATAGYHSFIGVHKPTKRGVLLMSNSASHAVSKCAVYMLLNLIGENKELALHPYCEDEIYEEITREFTGLFRYKGMEFYVSLNRGKLFLRVFGHDAVQLHPETPFKWHIRSNGATVEFDGVDWRGGRPAHTLIYTSGEMVFNATRDGQEFRKFLDRSKEAVKRLFGRTPQP